MQLLIKNKDKTYIVEYDFEDIDLVNKYKWRISIGRKDNWTNYVHQSGVKRKYVSLHRLIMERIDPDFDRTLEIDHIDGNGLNNRRNNLRLATSTQNKHNRRSFGKVPYVGVHNNNNLFGTSVRLPESGLQIKLGQFTDVKDAATVYDLAALYFYKEFANLNFPSRIDEYKTLILENDHLFKNPKTIRNLVSPKFLKYKSIETIVISHLTDRHEMTTNEIWELFDFSKATVTTGLKAMVKSEKLKCKIVFINKQKHFIFSLNHGGKVEVPSGKSFRKYANGTSVKILRDHNKQLKGLIGEILEYDKSIRKFKIKLQFNNEEVFVWKRNTAIELNEF